MITARSLSELPAHGSGTVASIGVFDGVHLGHQAILAANVERARQLGCTPAVVTFGGHPKRVLLGHAPKTLTTLEHRLAHFKRAGIEVTLVLDFDEELRSMSAEHFIDRILLQGLDARAFVLGFDSKVGKQRSGDPQLLTRLGHAVEVVPRVRVRQRAISSTAIREAVELGDLEGAACMLGRPVAVLGEVVHGQALGRTLGFPTANLDLHHELHPPNGVYAGLAYPVRDGTRAATPVPAVANIGTRPTLAGMQPGEPTVEVHLLDFSEDLYGLQLEFEFVQSMRSEQRFADLDQLRTQISRDVEQAREILRARNTEAHS